MMRLAARLTLAIAILARFAAMVPDACGQPTLSHTVPGGLAPGKTTDVVLHGTKLAGPVRVWTSFPAQVEVVAADAKQTDDKRVACKFTVGQNVPLGIGGIAVATPAGVSDVLYVMIDDLASALAGSSLHAAATPQDVMLPIAIDGQCEGTLCDYYRFAAKGGERISCEVLATRLGWDFDPLVRVLDARGKELLLADDDPASGADPRFVFTAPADGQYLLELRDNRYKPGGRYRLRLGNFPLVTTPLPLAVQRGGVAKVEFLGPRIDDPSPFVLAVPAGGTGWQEIRLGTAQDGGSRSGWTTLQTTDLPVHLETVSAGNAREATAVSLPGVAAGILEKPGDVDFFEFQGKKGMRCVFRALTRSAGSAAVLSLRLNGPDGKQVAESQVTDSDEPVFNVTLPADGAYQLAVEELVGRGGSDFAYAVECRAGAQFSLTLKNDKNNRLRYSIPTNGGAFYLDVQCPRLGYEGPISLGIESPRSGWQVFNNSAAKANEQRIYVVAPQDLAAGEMAELRVVGRGEQEGRSITQEMTTTLQLRASRPQMAYPPAWHDGTIFVSARATSPSPFAVTATQPEVKFSRELGQAEVALDFERLDAKFKEAPVIVTLGQPAAMSADIKREGPTGTKETYRVVLKAAKNLPAGQHALRFFTYAESGGQGRGVVSGDVRLIVPVSDMPAAAAEAK